MAASGRWFTIRTAATVFGLVMLAIYVAWNIVWLARGEVPPSLLTGLTGIPAPTTGGTRSIRALLGGDPLGSLYYNPMTAPILGMLALTLFQVCRRGRAAAWVGGGWAAVLSLAWVLKLLSPADTW